MTLAVMEKGLAVSGEPLSRVAGPAPSGRCVPAVARAVRWVLLAAAYTSAAVVALALASLTLLPHFGARGLVVTSGSMAPAIDAGDLVVVRSTPPARIGTGHVIAFQGYRTSGLTTHRVVARRPVGGAVHFRTKGDANDTPDVDLAPADGVLGRVVARVPRAGRLLAVVASPPLRLVLLGAPAAWLAVRQARVIVQAVRQLGPRRHRPGLPTAVVVSLLAAVALGAAAARTGAVLVDTVDVVDNTFATADW